MHNTAKGKIENARSRFAGLLQESITYRSSWELKAFGILDKFTKMGIIKAWASEKSVFDYVSPVDEKNHRYYMDITMLSINDDGRDKVTFIEIKPLAQTTAPRQTAKKSDRVYRNELRTYVVNNAKWNAVKDFCVLENENLGYAKYDFIIWSEKELNIT